ncbi:MAG: DUF5615 family PIN-like protein [Acidimicrobiales bacterium]
MRFFVDHCVPVEVARSLRAGRRQYWTALEARLSDAEDLDLIVYTHAKQAILATTNRDSALAARWQRSAGMVWLQVREQDATAAIDADG